MKNFLTVSAIGAMMTAGVAIAMQGPAPAATPKPTITKAQAIERADARFDRLDTNKDGQLDAAERKAGADVARKAMAERKGGELSDFVPGAGGRGGMGERMLARIDTNGDGKISKAENRAAAEARFARMDRDGDGTIVAGERGMGKGKWKRGEGKHMGRPGGGKSPAMAMKGIDTDGDGVITRAEFDAHSAKRFARLDTNGDGRIDAAEMQAQRTKAREAMKKMREHRRGNTPAPSSTPGTE